MSTKHTPGPWSVEDDTPFSLWVSCPDGKNPLHMNRLNRDRLANATLIAAAPDLLSALQTAELALRERGLRACGEYKQIEAAIAKATGSA
ncbi:hypothetical protein [Stenotrophomonas geniculata]|uniref:hypothetical protein n=1 Tax=Stenotrophomonas geniculata TaxID=86188 RepID=UPI0024795A8A|nr:hypothetical protein [Stenotrophomonas geniculata]MDH7548241.1 hypothetical protein [Stenotrophomonas geniculata]